MGLRPTRQRLALAGLLFQAGHRHVTAEKLHGEAMKRGIRVSLATIYNTLHQFTAAGLLREVVVDTDRSYFDTNMERHHHFFHEDTGLLEDIPSSELELKNLPPLPEGSEISSIDVVIRLSGTRKLPL